MSDEIKRRLDTMRICTDESVQTLISCWLIEAAARHLLKVDPALFWRPYYNTPLVPMLRAHSDEQIVRMYAFLCGTALCKNCRAASKRPKTCAGPRCGKSLTDGVPIRGLDHLKNHRDVVGHPLTWHLDRAGVRKFVDAKRDRSDLRPAIVWDIHRSIVDAQVAAGIPATVLDLRLGPYQVQVLDSILKLCLQPGDYPFPDDFLTELMRRRFWNKARVDFEKYPDGQLPRKTDAELEAIYKKARDAWYASRPPPST